MSDLEKLEPLLEGAELEAPSGGAEAGALEELAAFFASLSEPARRALAPACLRRFKRLDEVEASSEQRELSRRSLLWTLNGTELGRIPTWQLRWLGPEDLDALRHRRPKWLASWAKKLLKDGRWGFVYSCVRAGLIEPPEGEDYVLGMISGLAYTDGAGQRLFSDNQRPLVEQLRADPELPVWALFEFEGETNRSLANYERWTRGQRWSEALAQLSQEGLLDRSRLLKSSLQALAMDMAQYRARWFTGFYDLLKPSEAELREGAEALLGLVSVSAASVVSWALKKIGPLIAAGVYPPAQVAAGLRPALSARTKAPAKRALSLLKKLAKASPEAAPQISEAAMEALGHEAAEIQEAAIELVLSLGPPPAGIEAYQELIAPSLRGRLFESQLAEPEPAPDPSAISPELRALFSVDTLLSEGVPRVLPAACFDGTELPRLSRAEPIHPVDSLDELLELLAQLLEDSAGADDIERALDGLSRMADARLQADFQARIRPLSNQGTSPQAATGGCRSRLRLDAQNCVLRPSDLPLSKRARALMKRGHVPFAGLGPAADACGLVLAWTTGERFTVSERGDRRHVRQGGEPGYSGQAWTGGYVKTMDILSRRLLALSDRLAEGRARPSLCAPTHSGALIDPKVLVDRLLAWEGDPPDTVEVQLSLLRLAFEGRAAAAARLSAAAPTEEYMQAILHGMGGELPEDVSFASTELWAAAARARAPWEDDPRVLAAFPEAGPDVGGAAKYHARLVWEEYGRELGVQAAPVEPGALIGVASRRGKIQDLDSPDCIPELMHAERGRSMWELGGVGGRSAASVRWYASLWPTAREALFANAAIQLAGNIDWGEAWWYSKHLLEPLFEPATPLRPMACLALAAGLGCKEPGEHGLAVDAAIAAIEDGRLGSDNLGAALALLIEPVEVDPKYPKRYPGQPTGLILAARWAKTLGEVAKASPAHAAVVRLALSPCLTEVQRWPRDFGKLLALIYELSVELELPPSEAELAWLCAQKGSSKLAKTARAMCKLSGEGGAMRAAVRQLARLRIEAAARWM